MGPGYVSYQLSIPNAQFRVYKTEAIVLERRDFGEADRLLTLYTPAMGKVRAIAKGSRRTTSKLSGHIELFTHTHLFLATGRNLDIISQSQLIHSHERLREDLWRAALGFHVVELVNHFSEERLENPGVWRALLDVLRRLDSEPNAPAGPPGEALPPLARDPRPELAVRNFESQLLEVLGYRPELRCCTLCRERLEPLENFFHAGSGGMLCPGCADGQNQLLPLSVEAVKVLRLLQEGDYGTATRLRLSAGTLRELEATMRRHITWVLERDLRTTHLLDELRVSR
jgi:DNA repair protein RecO (recombination protein O)